MPTFNDFERGPLVIDDDERIILANYQKGEPCRNYEGFYPNLC